MDNTFAKDVFNGLTAQNKFLYSKYFYDDIGSRIFQEIMEMPEYYLTQSEFEIFKAKTAEIYAQLEFNQPFNLIELGAGDGVKTAEIIRFLIEQNVEFTYQPIDISKEANDILSAKLKSAFPTLKIAPQTGDYFEILADVKASKSPSLLLFIGSNIGNYRQEAALELFDLFQQSMKPGDKLLVGVDLKKNPKTIRQAYDDPHGITARFNLNLLNRINNELGGNFNLNEFDFYANYDPGTGEVRSYLVSLKDQDVRIDQLETTVHFTKGETIWTELSKKYDLNELTALVEPAGFELIAHFLDDNKYFSDSLFKRK